MYARVEMKKYVLAEIYSGCVLNEILKFYDFLKYLYKSWWYSWTQSKSSLVIKSFWTKWFKLILIGYSSE